MKRNRIEFGDRIFTRLTMGGKIIFEFMINRVADMTELLGELRQMTRGMRGLAKLYIRNQSRGWSQERPLMLYAANDLPRNNSPFYTVPASQAAATPTHPRTMLFPWEVH